MWTLDTHVKTENWNVNQNSADRNYKMEDFIKKKIINSSDNYHYHKLDIRKSEIVFTFCSKVNWRKSKLSHRSKKKDEQRKMENLHQILMKIIKNISQKFYLNWMT